MDWVKFSELWSQVNEPFDHARFQEAKKVIGETCPAEGWVEFCAVYWAWDGL